MTSLHVREAAILAGDLPPDIRDVIEELVADGRRALVEAVCLAEERDEAIALLEESCTLGTDVRSDGWIDWFNRRNRYLATPAEPASPSTDSEAGQ